MIAYNVFKANIEHNSMDERKGNSCSEEEDGSIHEIQTVQRGYRLHQLQKIGQQGEGRGEKGSPYLRENDRNGSEEEPKAFFNYARSKIKTRTGISDLEYPDGRMAHTDLLNAFFSDVFTEEDLATIPTFEQRTYIEPLTDITINDDVVAAVLGRLKPNKSPGGDGLHLRVLVELKNEMATPLRMIFTRSLHEGQLPPSWKEANVTPFYKKGKRHIPGNYRPVSLTSVAGKCMERLIRDAIMTHMTENDLLSPKQHGFVQGRSCVTQLLAVLDSWTLDIDEGGNIDTIYLDFAKAFDTVPHQRLLMKLRGYGIEGRILT